MKLKSFEEFKRSLTQEDKDYIHCVNDENPMTLDTNLENSDAIIDFAVFITSFSFKMNIRLLELYHKWISEQL